MKLKISRTTLFWSALVSGILIFAQQVSLLFGFEISDDLVAQIMTAVGTLLSILVLLGVLTNSEQANAFEAKVLKKKQN